MNTSTAARTTAPTASLGWGKRILIAVAILAAVILLLIGPFLRHGAVVGEEFDSAKFVRRSYHYWEVPWIHYQVTPLVEQNETNDLEMHLVQKKLIATDKKAKPRWDLVTVRRAELEGPPGDALILCRYLDQTNADGEFIWLEWTKKNQQLAKQLWPAVAEAARRELYFVVPDLFHLAESGAAPAALKDQLSSLLAAEYARVGRVEQELGRHERAVQWFDLALKHDPESKLAAEGRAKALREAPKSAEAAPAS